MPKEEEIKTDSADFHGHSRISNKEYQSFNIHYSYKILGAPKDSHITETILNLIRF